ncbi:MAG TPA: efflux transporter outer membrane subunit [Tepidisphaeraceae bacterium]|nr:efflux transporter outer membrane subunit [Tepidisphaeraceae bacterium]
MKKGYSMRAAYVLSAAVLSALVIAGCKVGPDYKAPTTQVAVKWSEPLGQGPTTQPALNQLWWRRFNDPELNSLVVRAARSNLDVKLAAARVREARALRRLAGADEYPTVDVGGSYTHSRNTFGATGSSQSAASIPSPGVEYDLYRAGFDASWEIDVFGGVRRNIEAATADVQAAMEARNSALVSLVAETALNYVQLRGFQERLKIAQDNIHVQQQSLDLTRTKFQAGLISELDVSRAQAQVAVTEAQIPSVEQSIRQTIHRLEVLLAVQPGALAEELSPAKAIPGTPPVVPIGIPSDVLRRRPDVRQAERNLAAATARIGFATADLFPKFSLTGSIGYQATQFGNLGSNNNMYYSIGPGITWPIFDAGRIRANIKIANARQEEAFIQWQQAVLQSLSDTEVALVAYTQEQARFQKLTEAVEANKRAVATSTQLYERGLGDFLNVLDAQRDLFASQDAEVVSRQTVSTNLVQLYKALGGGWEPESAATQPVASR